MSFRLASAHSHGPHPLDAPRNWSHGPRRFARCPHIHSHRIPLPSWLHTNYNPRGPSNSWLHHNNSHGKYRRCPASYIHGSCLLLGDAKKPHPRFKPSVRYHALLPNEPHQPQPRFTPSFGHPYSSQASPSEILMGTLQTSPTQYQYPTRPGSLTSLTP